MFICRKFYGGTFGGMSNSLNTFNLIKSVSLCLILNPVGAINNQSLINFLQPLNFPCGTYLGHLLQKSSQFDVRVQLNG